MRVVEFRVEDKDLDLGESGLQMEDSLLSS